MKRHWRPGRRGAALLVTVVTVISVGGYVALSVTVNGLPSYPRAGWVVVLDPGFKLTPDVVQLLVQARTVGGQTRAAYDVVVCGPRPFSGDLLMGGNAQFTKLLPNPAIPPFIASRVQIIHDLSFRYSAVTGVGITGVGGMVNLGNVQLAHISLPAVNACPPGSSGQNPGLPGGSAQGVAGITAGPVQQTWAGPWGWWHGPHASQSWPLTGALPGVPPSTSGEFIASSGLSGDWFRPLAEYNEVSANGGAGGWSIDSTVPSSSGPYPLVWQSRSPISPTAQLTDSPSLALLQDWVVIFAVMFGIAGSMLAGLFLEWLRPRHSDESDPVSIRSQPSPKSPRKQRRRQRGQSARPSTGGKR
jgi:hypothetical protein